MNTSRLDKIGVRGLQGLAAVIILIGPSLAWGSPPLETFPLPAFSFDRESPGATMVGADSILMHNLTTPTVLFPGAGLAMGRAYDDLDAISGANADVPAGAQFALLFSVDRESVGAALPDPALTALNVPFNVKDQAERGHAAGDLFMSTLEYTRSGLVLARGGLRIANNCLVVNNFDEGGRDFNAGPVASARDRTPVAVEDNVDAVASSTNGVSGAGLRQGPHFYYSVSAGSTSLQTFPGLPGSSPADVFLDVDPAQGQNGSESIYATANQLHLNALYDDIDALLVFDVNTNGIFDGPDRVLFSLARGSLTLQVLGASAADVFSVTPSLPPGAPPTLYAAAAALGLATQDNVDALEMLACTDGPDCARRFGIRAVRGDWENDNDVDLGDHVGVLQCLSGPWEAPDFVLPSDLCRFVFDDDHDLDVDLADFQVFQIGFTGPL
jgi:hypothetical protein